MATKTKMKSVFIPLIVLVLIIISSFSVLALDELLYSPFTEAGGWSSGSTYGRERAFEYNDILFIANGNDIYKYDMSTWEYLGTQALTYDINDLHAIDDRLYVTQNNEVWMYTISSDGTLTNDPNDFWDFGLASALTSFDIAKDESLLVATDNTGTVPIINYAGENQRNITRGVPLVKFSYDAEVVFLVNIGAYRGGVYAHAVSNGASLFEGKGPDDNYLRHFSISPIEDLYLSGWSYGFSDYSVYHVNFTSNSNVNYGIWNGYKLPHKADYSEDGILLVRMSAVDHITTTYLHVKNATTIGTFAATEYPEWAFVPTGNRYMIIGTSSNFEVVLTSVAQPLVTTLDVELNGTSALLSGAIVDIGDATAANCSIEYREEGVGDWGETTVNSYTNVSDFPDTFSEYVYSFVIGTDYEYRTKCDYAGTLPGTVYGTTKTFTADYPPFDPITAFRDNIFLIFGMSCLMGIIGFLASKGITNPFILLVVAVIGSFILTIVEVFTLTLSIFITIACSLIGIVISLLNGGNK